MIFHFGSANVCRTHSQALSMGAPGAIIPPDIVLELIKEKPKQQKTCSSPLPVKSKPGLCRPTPMTTPYLRTKEIPAAPSNVPQKVAKSLSYKLLFDEKLPNGLQTLFL